MRYFEKISEKEVGFGERLSKHPVSFILGGPGATYGASDKNLGTSNLGKSMVVHAGISGIFSAMKGKPEAILPSAVAGALGGAVSYGLGSVFGKTRKKTEYK